MRALLRHTHCQRRRSTHEHLNSGGDTALAWTRRPLLRVLHGRPRRRDRECRAAVDRGRSRLLAAKPAVGRERVRPDVRRPAAPRRPRRGRARPATDVRRRRRRVRTRLAARRPCVVAGHAHRGAGAAGHRRSVDDPGRALDPDDDVPRRRRTQQGAWCMGRRRRVGRHDRAAHRRRAHADRRLDVDLPAERPDRGGSDRRHPGAPGKAAAGRLEAAVRSGRRDHGDGGAVATCLHSRRRGHRRLGIAADDLASRDLGSAPCRLRRRRTARGSAAPSLPHLPGRRRARIERRLDPVRRRAVRDVLRDHAVPAAGAGLLAARGGARLACAVGDRPACLRRRRGARDASRAARAAGDGALDHHRRACGCSLVCPRTPVTCTT